MDLDRYEEFGKIDHTGIIHNIDEFGYQLESGFNEIKEFAFPSNFIQAKKIVLLGTDASLSANILIQTISRSSKIPVIVWSDEGIPHFVDSSVLVVAGSYTGDDEKTVNGFDLAAKAGAKLFAFSCGGMLASLSRKYKNPFFEISYGSSPDLAFGYNIAILYSLLERFEFVEVNKGEFVDALQELKPYQEDIKIISSRLGNPAKQLAVRLNSKFVHLYTFNELESIALRFSQQLENMSKYASSIFNLSKQNLSSIKYLNDFKVKDKIYNLILCSNYYSTKQISHIENLDDLLKKRDKFTETLVMEDSGSWLAELLKLISLVDYSAYYLAMLNNTLPENTGKIMV